MKRTLFLAISLAIIAAVRVQAQPLTLDSCRALALRNNKELRMSALKQEAAHWQHKSAYSNYFPRITAVGTYQRSNREISLLNDEQKEKFGNLGTNIAGALNQSVQQNVTQLKQNLMGFTQSPEFAALMQNQQVQNILAQNPTLVQPP